MTGFSSQRRVLAAEVHKVLRESNRPMSSKQIADRTGHTVREIVGALRILDDAGAVCKTKGEKHSEWSLPGVASLPRTSPHCKDKAQCRIRVISLMERTDHPMSKAEIAESIGSDLRTVTSILYNLKRDGRVRNQRNTDGGELIR